MRMTWVALAGVAACSVGDGVKDDIGSVDPVLEMQEPVGEAQQTALELPCKEKVNGLWVWVQAGEPANVPQVYGCAIMRCDTAHETYLDATTCGDFECVAVDFYWQCEETTVWSDCGRQGASEACLWCCNSPVRCSTETPACHGRACVNDYCIST